MKSRSFMLQKPRYLSYILGMTMELFSFNHFAIFHRRRILIG